MESDENTGAACPSCGAAIEGDLTACFSCGQALRSPPLKKGQRISGRYELTGVLGRGGMGTVYRAHDHSLDEEVALKVLTESVEDSPDSNRRFRAEIRLARKVRHPNVCAIHEYGEIEDLQYIVMELIHGQDLRKYLNSRGQLPMAEALDIARDIGEGLQAIHNAGVIHRDLKLANVMRDEAGNLRLMDFGIAKRAGDPMSTVTGHIMGTPEYMSPEQIQGQPVDIRTDIYSLGVVTYELLTGRLPFKAETPLGVILKQVNDPPSLDDPLIPPQVGAVLGKALAKKPDERFESARAFLEGLAHARSSLDSRERAAGPGHGAGLKAAGRRPPIQRRHWFIGVGTAALVLVGAMMFLPIWTNERERSPEGTDPQATPSERQRASGPSRDASPPMGASPAPTPAHAPTPGPVVEGAVTPPGARATPPAPPFSRAAREGERTSRPAAGPPAAASLSATPASAAPALTSPTPAAPSPAATTPSAPPPNEARGAQAPSPALSPAAPPSVAAPIRAPAGFLQIKVAPFAQLMVDGNDKGTVSDLKILEIAPGRHVIRFLHRDYQPLQRIVMIRAGETERLFVDLKLDAIAK